MIKQVREVMTRNPVTIEPYRSLWDAKELMRSQRIGGLPVVENEKLIGIITSKDLIFYPENRLVIDAMTEEPVVIEEKAYLFDAYQKMLENNIERLPVIDESGALTGIITRKVIERYIGSYIDSMTGLPKKEYAIYKCLKLLERGNSCTVAFIDLNNFGELNKRYGHVVGDQILLKVSGILKQLGEDITAARYGGDEFILILPYDEVKTINLVDKLLFLLENDKWPYDLKVRCAVGVKEIRLKEKVDIIEEVFASINEASLKCIDRKKEIKT
ncbi:GGDEF domain-containing protein [Carboxydothermus ferrireducens]|uniref:Diguanylate cyclase (GGDEF)-like protein n=1 Tax=Carboxydothermus ferrireducens DSM 11255 TaxID=1119529 RepID=A0ABX2RC61_9THEO|nr:GGDEF domain-containing protein [Carboxydothermus ferrireducens]NYE57445.1 diguanylate cyclase (GGDEF)-like protein [Carboxydothermus ferrireducens DSM 11255]